MNNAFDDVLIKMTKTLYINQNFQFQVVAWLNINPQSLSQKDLQYLSL